jgi:hypothetical protein
MPQFPLQQQFYQLATKAKARNDLRKQLEAEGFRAIQFEEKPSGRIFVWAWHLNPNAVFSKAKALGVRLKYKATPRIGVC